MKEKSKIILGLKKPSEFSVEERKMIIEESLGSGKTKREIWHKYTGEQVEHGKLVHWMRQVSILGLVEVDVIQRQLQFN